MSFIDFVMLECTFPDINPLYCLLLPLPSFTLLQSNSLFLPEFHKREKNLNTYIHKTDLFHSMESGTLHKSTFYSSTEVTLIFHSISILMYMLSERASGKYIPTKTVSKCTKIRKLWYHSNGWGMKKHRSRHVRRCPAMGLECSSTPTTADHLKWLQKRFSWLWSPWGNLLSSF